MTIPNFWEWSKDQPDIKPLQEQRDQYASEQRELKSQARHLMVKALSRFGCAEMIERSILEYQGTSEDQDKSMYELYGIHPEIMADHNSDAMELMLQMAYAAASDAIKANDAARSKEQQREETIKQISAWFDDARKRYDELKSQEEVKDV